MATRKGSDNIFPLVRLSYEDDTPATPASGQGHLVAGVDKVLRWIDSDGTLTVLGSATVDYGEDADIVDQDYDDVADAGVLDEVARADHRHGMPAAGGGGGSLTAHVDHLTADTGIGHNTFTDLLTRSLVAGTWLVIAQCSHNNAGGNAAVTLKIWDGTTAYAGAEANSGGTNFRSSISIVTLITLGSTTSIKLAAASNISSSTAYADIPENGTGLTDLGTTMVCVKVA